MAKKVHETKTGNIRFCAQAKPKKESNIEPSSKHSPPTISASSDSDVRHSNLSCIDTELHKWYAPPMILHREKCVIDPVEALKRVREAAEANTRAGRGAVRNDAVAEKLYFFGPRRSRRRIQPGSPYAPRRLFEEERCSPRAITPLFPVKKRKISLCSLSATCSTQTPASSSWTPRERVEMSEDAIREKLTEFFLSRPSHRATTREIVDAFPVPANMLRNGVKKYLRENCVWHAAEKTYTYQLPHSPQEPRIDPKPQSGISENPSHDENRRQKGDKASETNPKGTKVDKTAPEIAAFDKTFKEAKRKSERHKIIRMALIQHHPARNPGREEVVRSIFDHVLRVRQKCGL